MLIGAAARVGFEHGFTSFLELKEKRFVVAGNEQRDTALSADAADTDDLDRHIDEAITIEQNPPRRVERGAVIAKRALDGAVITLVLLHVILVIDERRVIRDAWKGAFLVRELVQLVVVLARLRRLEYFLATEGAQVLIGTGRCEGFKVNRGIPRIQHWRLRVFGHLFPVAACSPPTRLAAIGSAEAIRAAGDHKARDKTLDVPFPRRDCCFVEIIDVENELALGRGEATEVQQVTIAAGLHIHAGHWGPGKIAGHDCSGAAIERERRDHHPAVAQGNEIGQPALVGGDQQRDGVRTFWRRMPSRVRVAWTALPETESECGSLSIRPTLHLLRIEKWLLRPARGGCHRFGSV